MSISQGGGLEGDIQNPWPSRSPNLLPLDFFKCSYIKDEVLRVKVDNTDHLTRLIRGAVETETLYIFIRVWQEYEECP